MNIFLESRDDFIQSIAENKYVLEKVLKKIEEETNFEEKIKLSYQAINLLNNNSTGHYSSNLVEEVFCNLAQKHKVELSNNCKKNSILHIASEIYKFGGHSRAIERWIELSEDSEVHSVLLTRKVKSELPSKLLSVVKDKKGEIIELTNKNDIQKGLELREIASNFDKVILHIHMDDVIPLIAFGTTDFKRPIFFFNHADHRFWLGVSIADCIVDFREFGENITKNMRGGYLNYLLPLPINQKEHPKVSDILEIKKELNLPLSKKIIFTAGSTHKYKPLLQYNFVDYIKKIFDTRDDVFLLAIGPNQNKISGWSKLAPHQAKVIKEIPNEQFNRYLSCADLVIDSFPMSGGTVLLDAVTLNKPVLSLKCPTGQLDYIEKSNAYCADITELIDKTNLLLNNRSEAEKNIKEISTLLLKENSKESWLAKKNELYEKYTNHGVHKFKSIVKQNLDDLDFYLHQQTIKVKVKLHIPYLLTIYKYKKYGKSRLKFAFFNNFKENT